MVYFIIIITIAGSSRNRNIFKISSPAEIAFADYLPFARLQNVLESVAVCYRFSFVFYRYEFRGFRSRN